MADCQRQVQREVPLEVLEQPVEGLSPSRVDVGHGEQEEGVRPHLVVLGACVVPGARSVVSIPAGTSRMPLLRFTVLTAIGSAAWNAVLIGAGYVLGANWSTVQNWIGSYSNVVLAVAVVVAAVYLLYRGLRRRKEKD